MANTDFELGADTDPINSGNAATYGLAVASTTSATIAVSTAQFFRGTRSALITATTAGTSVATLGKTGTAADTAALRAVFRSNWPGASSIDLAAIRGGGANEGKVQLTTTGKLQFVGVTGSVTASTNLVPQTADDPNAWWTLEMWESMPTNTVKARAYLANDYTSPFWVYSNTLSGIVGASQFDAGRVGKLASAGSITLNVDDFDFVPGAADYLGPANANVPPVANAGPDVSVEPWTTVTLDGTLSSDSDGTIATYTWVQLSGTAVTLAGTGATRTFTAPASISDQPLVFGLSVQDNLSAVSSQDSVTVTVLRANEMAAVGGVLVPMQVFTT